MAETIETRPELEGNGRVEEEGKERIISFDEFRNALDVFGGDYAIVGHDGEPIVPFNEEPRPHGEYTVTGLGNMSEGDFAEFAKTVDAIVVNCMDKRGARKTYEEYREWLKKEKRIKNPVILMVAVGGGIVQQDEILRDGNKVNVGRKKAMGTVLQYLAQEVNPKHVLVTDHDRRCGAVAHFHDGQGLPERLGVEKGSEREQEEMKKLINAGYEDLVPDKWRGIVDKALVHFADDENGVEIRFF